MLMGKTKERVVEVARRTTIRKYVYVPFLRHFIQSCSMKSLLVK